MSIVERVVRTGLPLDQLVVIGSGTLDVLGLRRAVDIDLVATGALFEALQRSDEYSESIVHGETVLQKADQEIWLSWGSDGVPNFAQLHDDGFSREGVRFAHPRFVLEWKRANARAKDQNDILLLEQFIASSSPSTVL